MKRELTILLIEDEPNECAAFIQYINSIDNVLLIAVTNSSAKGIQYVFDYMPDAVILDLELHRGSGSGLLFLKELCNLNLNKQPYILVTTNNISEITYNQVRVMGADFIMHKHQLDYSAKSVVDFLLIMKDTIQNTSKLKNVCFSTNETENPAILMNVKLEKRIQRELDLVGISPKVIGRKYLVDAIQMVMNENNNNLCCEIAKKYNKSDASVERAMQNAINRAWRTTNIDDLIYHYTAKISSDKGVPTLTEFVYFYAQKLKEYLPIKN